MQQQDNIKSGFTLIELLVVISIISLLIAILLPALGKARQAAQKIACQSNQKGAGVMVHMYLSNNDDWLPAAHTYAATGNPQYGLTYRLGFAYDVRNYNPTNTTMPGSTFDCPTLDSSDYGNSSRTDVNEYGWNFEYMGGVDYYNGVLRNAYSARKNMNELTRTSDQLIFSEAANGSGSNDSGWKLVRARYLTGRHGEGNGITSNVMWLDGHGSNHQWDLLYSTSLSTFAQRHWWSPSYDGAP